MRALVTGAAGFIGRHLIQRLLRDGHSVRALLHASGRQDLWPVHVEIATGDVRDPQAMKTAAAGCEMVFHLAGKAHALTEAAGEEHSHHAINAEGTRNVIEGAVAGGAKVFVLFSSVKAMGEGGGRCVDESFDGAPETPYGRSKLEAERLVLDIGRRSGLHVACLRLPLVYGPGTKGNLFRMIAAIDRGLFPPLPELGNRRSMVHVSNVVDAAMLAVDHPAARGRCYIVTDARAYSTRELYELICRALGKRIPQRSVPLGLLAAAGRAGDLVGRVFRRRMPFDSDAFQKLIGSAWYSSERIVRELGYHPLMSFEAALPEMIAWYRRVIV
jgi:nucleoside-diphosphate-sugar epimerase